MTEEEKNIQALRAAAQLGVVYEQAAKSVERVAEAMARFGTSVQDCTGIIAAGRIQKEKPGVYCELVPSYIPLEEIRARTRRILRQSTNNRKKNLRKPSRPPPKEGKRKKVDTGKIMALHRAGWSNAKIADEMNLHPITVGKYIRQEENKDGSGND